MRLSKFIQAVSFGTLVALIYIHLQMQIVHLAYQGKGREEHIQRLSEANATTAYQILELKSVNHLGGRLLAEDRQYRFRDRQSTVQLVAAEPGVPGQGNDVMHQAKRENPLLSLLTVKAEARPRPREERDLFRILGKE